MNRNDARKIAESITNSDILRMFENAKAKITDWTKISDVNKGMTKGVAWNILAKDFDVNAKHHILAKTNMIREFGEFLPDQIKPLKPNREFNNKPPVHQNPKF